MYKILNRNSNRESVTTFSSILQTVKITSDHWGQANHEVHVESVALRYTPQGTGTFRCSWEFDNQGTSGYTVSQNPLFYSVMSTADPGTSFTLATNAADTTAADMVRDDDVYIQDITVGGQGKTFEFTITVSDESSPIFTGLEIVGGLGRSAAYVRGAY
jgi:hypothetical protein